MEAVNELCLVNPANEWIKFIGLLCLVWGIVTGWGSIQWIKERLGVGHKSEPKWLIPILLRELLDCCLCTGFWIGIIAYYPGELWLLQACIISLSAELFSRLIGYLFSRG